MDIRSMWTATFPEDKIPALTEPIAPESCLADAGKLPELPECNGCTENTTTQFDGGVPSSEASQELTHVRKRPIPRKGHKKSRRGCYGCKKRKIKCPETKPSCCNCEKAGMPCKYPQVPDNQIALRTPIPPPQSTPNIFSINDMRFFHHFIVKAYPHLPVGADQTWTMEVPAIAHQHDYLLHAMLALGASHLSLTTTHDVRSEALSHRIEAMNSLNKALSRPAVTKNESDARFAAFMVLTFDCSCMPDGFYDFLTMLRGCILNGDLPPGSIFANFAQEKHMDTMLERFRDVELGELNTQTLREAMLSLAAIEPLLEDEMQKTQHQLLMECIINGFSSPVKAYWFFLRFYNIVGVVSHTDFQKMIDPSNQVSKLILGHFIAIHVLLRQVSIYEMGERDDVDVMLQVILNWVETMDKALSGQYKQYNTWPRSFLDASVSELVASRTKVVRTRNAMRIMEL